MATKNCLVILVVLEIFAEYFQKYGLFQKFWGNFDILEQKSPVKTPKPLKTLKPLNSGSAKKTETTSCFLVVATEI